MTTISWLMLLEEIIAVYTDIRSKPINIKCSVIDCGTYTFHRASVRLSVVPTVWFNINLKNVKFLPCYIY
jgi:hypothetical protein